ncbi:unnamed protein product [Microthlaspi erraticum]|uniref:Fe2OG dioxygenase domain-containing protein n=1 Tax=Microthlaspi erraticum TaxID=1685480 RepID=A0A6D2J9K8_9BRAS|nr:unnamed protein product [Microthlaspi erraticum]
MEHTDTFNQIVGDLASVDVKIENKNKDMILSCSLPPLLTALSCNKSGNEDGNGERWLEVLSREPRAFLYHNFLTNEECEHLINLAKPKMGKSLVRDTITGGSKESSARTSSGTFFKRGHDKIVEEIEKKISEFTFIPVENGEGLQVIRYEVGQKFDPHFDGYERIATVLMYLSDVERGGETVFPDAKGKTSKKGLSVSPKKRDALLFWNMKLDGTQDLSTGRPVIRGHKWASTKWLHVHEYKATTAILRH